MSLYYKDEGPVNVFISWSIEALKVRRVEDSMFRRIRDGAQDKERGGRECDKRKEEEAKPGATFSFPDTMLSTILSPK